MSLDAIHDTARTETEMIQIRAKIESMPEEAMFKVLDWVVKMEMKKRGITLDQLLNSSPKCVRFDMRKKVYSQKEKTYPKGCLRRSPPTMQRTEYSQKEKAYPKSFSHRPLRSMHKPEDSQNEKTYLQSYVRPTPPTLPVPSRPYESFSKEKIYPGSSRHPPPTPPVSRHFDESYKGYSEDWWDILDACRGK